MPQTDEFYESLLPELTGSICEVLTLENRLLFVGEFYSYDPVERLLQVNLRRGDATPGGVIHHTPVKLQLHGIELLTADDGRMMVLDEILRELACVSDYFFADAVLNEGLLKQCITAVFLVS